MVTAGIAAPNPAVSGDEVVVIAPPGSLIEVGEDRYAGPLRLVASDEGVVMTETLSIESYLLGIREVPASWPTEALKAQAVAARTYLAYTLASGRTSSGERFGYDICATTACQVYRGHAELATPEGQRWAQAVAATSGEILLYDGRPAQALYSSTSGTKTRESEDIFPGLDVPYLAAVPSPGEDSPFVNWSFDVSESEMTALLAGADLLHGPLSSVTVVETPDGGGPWQVQVSSGGQVEQMGTYQFRSAINAAAAAFPERFPAERPDGRRYPQTVLSGTYEISALPQVTDHGHYRELGRSFRFSGEGWGHQVGMSQYGALAMAEAGATYSEILAHYYGGLLPQPGAGWLPGAVTVGLALEVDEIEAITGPGITVAIDGVEVGTGTGRWELRPEQGKVTTSVPVGIGEAPSIEQIRLVYGPSGYRLRFTTTAPGEVTILTNPGEAQELGLFNANPFDVGIPLRPNDRFRITVSVASPEGTATKTLIAVPEHR